MLNSQFPILIRREKHLTTNIEDKDSPRILKIGNAAKPLAILIDRHAGWC